MVALSAVNDDTIIMEARMGKKSAICNKGGIGKAKFLIFAVR